MYTNDAQACSSNTIALSWERDIMLQDYPAIRTQSFDERLDTTIAVIGKDNSNSHLKIAQSA
jgi:hypothetical protein